MIPLSFLSYGRADEPFATALLGAALIDRIGGGRVFLDTASLDRGRDRGEVDRCSSERRRHTGRCHSELSEIG
jgi:hypothetical protein